MIMIFAGRRDDRCALHVAGHAGYANKGQDIVCAAVSTLVNTLAGALAAFDCRGFRAKLQPGDARITCAASGATDVLFYAAVIGLAQLQNTYPNYIQMRTEGYFCADREEESV
ncbi:ribosomal-processing cysteine protease Prp [Butyricicoccus pullicaecorum]|uniref:ribosomal-processing cysteine protease Prp n=1 Tax=Butyricicoccus pullicaecorum TaxID=501571 RepID=UPI003521DDFE